MNSSEALKQNLEQVLWGSPWYGDAIFTVIDHVHFEAAFEKPTWASHSIAEIVLHMLSWTEEVMDRLNGLNAQTHSSGDWPEVGLPDEQKWQTYVNDLRLVNVNLIHVIQNFAGGEWDILINDNRQHEQITTYKQLVEGFIQHKIYHTGQISILQKLNNG
jgi:uncharacterized damage-inducible protein DinB